MSTRSITLAAVNALSYDDFVAALGPLFEHSPWIAAATWPARPFATLDQLHQVLCATMYAAPLERQVALIQAHPDLAGKAAIAGELTTASAREQSSAGLSQLSPEEFADFTRLNNAYRERFGFPFVICAREHNKTSILEQFVLRLEHGREQEISAALGEIAKIARLRLLDAVQSE
ncbi:MAG TPA: 2-oxo-4-hydroxy-4-carboxy-5-ureidoimidazoline decarboxylase [Roseiflexaceae bacterium]|nr:2-oxo-4-hydroxy-4-carboxy-5-ureidoimidazoline decarboxylase [Roseiflexaceae bacterium]